MPSIKLSNDVFNYKTHPLFLGIKQINKSIATENLLLLKTFLEEHEVKFGLIAGTLLGAVRENDFISHDEDIDLFVLGEQKQHFLDLLPELRIIDFIVARYDRRGLLSIMRNGEYIDIYFFQPICTGIRHCCGWCVPEELLLKTTTLEFKGERFVIPEDFEGFLVYEYGYNWATPIKWVDFEMPNWKRILCEWKELLKEKLPDFLFYPIAYRTEKKVLKKYIRNMERYNKLRNASLVIPI